MATVQELQFSDISEVVDFIRGLSEVDPEIESIEEPAFVSFLEQSCNLGGRDSRIVRHGHQIIGVLLSGRFEVMDHPLSIRAFRIFVAPDEDSVARQLLDIVEAQDAFGQVTCRTVIRSSRLMAKEILLARRYQDVQEVSVLRRESLPLSPAVLPHGFKLRDAVPELDADTVTQLYNIANRRSFGFAPLTSDELNETLGLPGGRLLIIEDDANQVVGSVQTMPYFDGVGVIHAVQVLPEFQGRGLGRFLVAVAMNVLAQHGFRTIELSVDASNHAAMSLYKTFGFVEWSRDVIYEKLFQ